MNHMKEHYNKVVVPALKEARGYKNVMQVPRLQKIVINMGVGEAVGNRKILDEAIELLSNVTGQKAIVTKAKTAISNFKLREGLGIGAKVTLHGDNMWDFLNRFINIDLPRVRDFKGIPRRGFDGCGNYTMGVKDQTIFVEVDIEKITQTLGMDISFVTSAKNDEDGRALLEALGLPFRK
jgi:large subunit ribosomal protein L5